VERYEYKVLTYNQVDKGLLGNVVDAHYAWYRSDGSTWELDDPDDVESILDDLGAEGWELVSYVFYGDHEAHGDYDRMILKRPLTAD